MLPPSLILAAGALGLVVPSAVLAQTAAHRADPGYGSPEAVRYQVNTSTPAWSPDGRRIAFVRGTGGNSDIYVMNGNYLPEIRQMTQDRFNYMTVDHE